MKMVYCTCNVSILEELVQTLEKSNVRDYQIYDEVRALNKKGDPRLNNAVWPGHNASVIMQISEEEKVKNLAVAIRQLNKKALNNNELITFACWTLEEYFFE